HPRLRQDLRIHHDDVRHREKRRHAAQQLATHAGLVFLQTEKSLHQEGFLPPVVIFRRFAVTLVFSAPPVNPGSGGRSNSAGMLAALRLEYGPDSHESGCCALLGAVPHACLLFLPVSACFLVWPLREFTSLWRAP